MNTTGIKNKAARVIRKAAIARAGASICAKRIKIEAVDTASTPIKMLPVVNALEGFKRVHLSNKNIMEIYGLF